MAIVLMEKQALLYWGEMAVDWNSFFRQYEVRITVMDLPALTSGGHTSLPCVRRP